MKKNNLEFFYSGNLVKSGVYACFNCGQKMFVEGLSVLKKCSKCGLNKFTIEKYF